MKFKVGDILRMVKPGDSISYRKDLNYPLKCIQIEIGFEDELIRYKNLVSGKIDMAYKYRFDQYKEITEEDIL